MASRAFAALLAVVVVLVVCSPVPRVRATDPGPLQDFCVADNRSLVFVNGFVCKNPDLVTANDFFLHGLNVPGNTMNPQGFMVTPVSVVQLPGLNTLGVSMARIDYAPNGQNPPHTHPRATEVLIVIMGQLLVGFVTSNPKNQLITKQLMEGDVFVFPEGLIHFQLNNGHVPAVAITGFSSQNPGVITIANAVFASKPPINDDILAKAFMIEKDQVHWIQAKLAAPPAAGGMGGGDGGNMSSGGGGGMYGGGGGGGNMSSGGGGGMYGGGGGGGGYPGMRKP